MSCVGLIVSIITIVIVYKNRQFRTFNNILTCNSSVAAVFYSTITIIKSIPGFREDWTYTAPLCSLRAFCFNFGVAIMCHSRSMHAISRLFFTVFTKRRYLVTWRAHRIMICLSWLISCLVCIPPFFIPDGYALEIESRSCVISSKMYLLAFYISTMSCFIPFTIITSTFVVIFLHVRRSTRRVRAINHNTAKKSQRDVKLMKQMLVQTNILISGGPIFIFLVFWHAFTTQPPPEPLYLLGFTLMIAVGSIAPIVQFIMNRQLKQFALTWLHRRRTPVLALTPIYHQRHV